MSENHSEMLQEHSIMLQEVRTLDIVAAEIRSYTWSMLTNIIEIGRRLVEAKEMLPHGEFMNWCTENFGYSKSQTNNFMRLYEAYGSEQNSIFGAELNRQTFGTLNYSKALALLALPSAEEREAFIEENNVDEMTTRELQRAIREKQEAEERLKSLQADMDGERKALTDAREQIAKLAELNRELENRPRDVAIETVRDEEAIAAAAKEAREAAVKEYESTVNNLNRKLSQTEKDSAKTVEDLKKKLQDMEKALNKKENEALGAEDKLRQETEKLKGEISAAQQELEAARKQLKISSADVAEFGVWFKQVQADFSSLIDALGKVEKRDAETGAKLRSGVRQLLATMSGTVQEG